MKAIETATSGHTLVSQQRQHRQGKYHKVTDARKREVRGLWQRNDRYYARLTVEDAHTGRKAVKWVPLGEQITTPAQAIAELKKLHVERSENRLRPIGMAPTFADYLATHDARLEHSGKKPRTLITERSHFKNWKLALGHLRLDQIRPHHITAEMNRLRAAGRSARTVNLSLVALRSVLKAAKVDGHLKTLPVEGIEWLRTEKHERKLYTPDEVETFIKAAFGTRKDDQDADVPVTRNAQEFVDYLRFLQYTGAREKEALKVRWVDVNFEAKFVTIGAEGDTKNRERRHVDFNPSLEAHLRDLRNRRQGVSAWLFPSPQRGSQDIPARSFRESLLLVRDAAKMPGFGFHDLRHHFISYAVMAGIDYMTIAKWVGHKDGGVLIGKVYGHLADEHRKAQAARLNFAPAVVPSPSTEVLAQA